MTTDQPAYVEPYSSCMVFGALRYFGVLRNTVCLIHGPAGCAFFQRTGLMVLNQKYENWGYLPRIYSTNFNENDAIFGAQQKVSDAVRQIDTKYSPDLIVVFNCCVTEIIGESINDVIDSLQGKVNSRLLAVQAAGFKGDHKKGLKYAAELLFTEFMAPQTPIMEEGTINLIGEVNPQHVSVLELKDILHRAGVKILSILPAGACVEDILTAPSAALNYLVCGSAARTLTLLMEQHFSIPCCGGGGGNSLKLVEK